LRPGGRVRASDSSTPVFSISFGSVMPSTVSG
jgi:hypothetical protein